MKTRGRTKGRPPGIHLARDKRGVATLTVDNRERLNILGVQLIADATRAVRSLQSDDGLRVLVLTGAGAKAFIGGADIREMAALSPDSARGFITNLHNFCQALRDLPVPVIAKIRGYCLGAGLEVAASCDLRVAAKGSQFSMPEVKVGIPSVIEAALLPSLIGWGKTRELLYTGKFIGAEEALRWGLVGRVVPAAALDRAAEEWIGAILECGPQAIRSQKALLLEWEKVSIDEAIDVSISAFSLSFETGEPQQMMGAFLNRSRRSKPKKPAIKSRKKSK